mmetsp:Transcript_37152/g.106335  ORF Transcript_37152/g.106335 Transcript_37152/m.106335 type:complete len:521 (-) Transcript_37152:435-1997(-)
MDSGGTAEAVSTTDGHPSPQAVLAKARDLYKSIGTQEAYDHAVQQRGLEALEADITAVISDICHLIASASEPQVRTDVVRQLVQLLSIKRLDGTIEQKAIDAGVLPALVEQLSGCEEVQRQAALALGELAITHGDLVVDAGAVPPLVQLVSSADDNVRGAAIAALCIITTESSTCRDAVLAAGVLQPLLKAMRESTSDADVLYLGAELLINLWSVRPLPVPLAECAPFLPVLVGLISKPEQDDSVLRSARGALGHFGMLSIEAHGTDADRDALVECGAVTSIKRLLESTESDSPLWYGGEMAEPRMKYGAWMVVFLAAGGTTAHKQALIDGDLVPRLIDVAASGETDEVVKDMAAISVGNVAMGGSQQQVEHAVECGGIQFFCDLLDGDDSTRLSGMISVLDKISSAGRQKQANEGLPDNPYSTLVEQAGGVDKMTELQSHNDIRIASRAIVFLISHFPTRLDEQRLLALYQLHVVQAAEVETNVGPDDDICSSCDSDGEGEGEVNGQLEGDSGEEGAEG